MASQKKIEELSLPPAFAGIRHGFEPGASENTSNCGPCAQPGAVPLYLYIPDAWAEFKKASEPIPPVFRAIARFFPVEKFVLPGVEFAGYRPWYKKLYLMFLIGCVNKEKEKEKKGHGFIDIFSTAP